MTEPAADEAPLAALQRARAIAERSSSGTAEASSQPESARQTQLALSLRFEQLTDTRYPLPNSLARGGLFAAIKDGKRAMLRDKSVVTTSQYSIQYTGDQLNQSDLDVLLALLTHARELPLGEVVSFTAYSVLRRMNWALNSESYERLRQSLYRLQRAQVQIAVAREKARPIKFVGSFINNFIEDDRRGLGRAGEGEYGRSQWTLRFDGDLSALFADDEVTLGLWYFRRKVDGRMPLAQFLLNLYITHRKPIPLSVAKLRELSGTNERNQSNFVGRLEKALQKLVNIGFLKGFRISSETRTSSLNHMVHVERVEQETIAQLARAERDKHTVVRRASRLVAG